MGGVIFGEHCEHCRRYSADLHDNNWRGLCNNANDQPAYLRAAGGSSTEHGSVCVNRTLTHVQRAAC